MYYNISLCVDAKASLFLWIGLQIGLDMMDFFLPFYKKYLVLA